MAGETIDVLGTYQTVCASDNPTSGAFSTGAKTSITTALGATESKYPLLDFRATVTAGTPAANGRIDIFKKSGGDQPDPKTSYLQQYVGTMVLDATTGNYYLYGVPNGDPSATYWPQNQSGVQLTFSLLARGRTYTAAP